MVRRAKSEALPVDRECNESIHTNIPGGGAHQVHASFIIVVVIVVISAAVIISHSELLAGRFRNDFGHRPIRRSVCDVSVK